MHFSVLTASVSLAAFAVTMLLVTLWFPGHLAISLIAAVIAACAVWWWFYHFELLVKTQTPNYYQARAAVHHSMVPPSAINRNRHHLLEGEEIHDIRRKSVWHLVRQIRFEAIITMILLVAMVVVGFHLNPLPKSNNAAQKSGTTQQSQAKTTTDKARIPVVKPPGPGAVKVPSIHFQWWYLLLALFITVYLMYRKWLYWASWFIIYTKDRLLVVVEPFAIYPFYKPMMDDEYGMTGTLRIKIEVKGNTYAKKWGKAAFSVATIYSDEEESSVRDIIGLPDPDGLKARIDTDIREREKAKEEQRLQIEREQAERQQRILDGLEASTQSTRELTELIRRSLPGN